MIKTLPLHELDKYADNVYESIIMISRRARKINELQKEVLDAEAASITDTDNYDDEGVSQDLIDRQYLKLPKPTTIALQEMMGGQLSKEYKEYKED
ncbi:DNA-directed RNA polymerase subunit omega [candidate division KSB1 bacterium]|nr:DNA-directed RNA polymerase subunit omega [candidate division KSB1 bacterium]